MSYLAKILVAGAVVCALGTDAKGQYQYQPYSQQYEHAYPYPQYYPPVEQEPQPYYRTYRRQHNSDLSYKCAKASEFIRNNNCGPKGCDEGLCVALQHGCHINSWGHTCSHPYRSYQGDR